MTTYDHLTKAIEMLKIAYEVAAEDNRSAQYIGAAVVEISAARSNLKSINKQGEVK